MRHKTRKDDENQNTRWWGWRKRRLGAPSTAGEQISQPGNRFSDRLLLENLHQLLLPAAFTRACVNASFSHCHGCEGTRCTARRTRTSEPTVRWPHVHAQNDFLSLRDSSTTIFIYFSPPSAGICLFLLLPLRTTSNNLAGLCRPPTDKYTSKIPETQNAFLSGIRKSGENPSVHSQHTLRLEKQTRWIVDPYPGNKALRARLQAHLRLAKQ